jgi:DNA-binding transcriptional LysR family regulator
MRMSLDLLQLKSVSLAARLGSLSRAAEALNITQSALSRRIAEAERALGVGLFERLSRGVKPTEACLAFLRHAEIALVSLDDGRDAARDVEGRRRQEVPIGLIEVLCDEILFDACRSQLQTADFKICLTSADVSAELLSGSVKLGLRYRRDASPQLESAWLATDAVVVACAPTHPLAAAARAALDELEVAQWIGFPAALDRTVTSYQEGLRLAGFQSWRMMTAPTLYARLRLLEAGFGVGMVRRACILPQLREGRLVELETPLSEDLPIFLAWRRGRYLGEAVEAMRDRIVAAYASTA